MTTEIIVATARTTHLIMDASHDTDPNSPDRDSDSDSDAEGELPLSMYTSLLDIFEKDKAITRRETRDCVIRRDQIVAFEYYYLCMRCNCPISYEVCREWFERQRTCPHCRYRYYLLPQLYRQHQEYHIPFWQRTALAVLIIILGIHAYNC